MRVIGEAPILFWLPAWVIVLFLLVLALFRAPWKGLSEKSERQHVFFALVLFYSVFWHLNVEVRSELEFHLLGVTTAVLLFGWQLAVIAGCLASLVSLLAGADWQLLGVEMLFSVVIPASVIVVIHRLISRLPGINLFAYILGIGFFGSMVAVLGICLSGLGYFALLASEPAWLALKDYYYVLLLMMFPEGFINGATVAMLAAFRPDLLKTLDEDRLIDGQ